MEHGAGSEQLNHEMQSSSADTRETAALKALKIRPAENGQ